MATRKKTTSTRSRKTKKQRMQEMEKVEAFRKEVVLWFIVAVSLILFISNLGFGGTVGNGISGILFGLFGLVAYIFPFALFFGCFFGISNYGNKFATLKIVAGIIFLVFLCVFMDLATYGEDVVTPLVAFKDSVRRKSGGGLLGEIFAYFLVPAFGIIGSYIIDIIVLIISIVLITGKSAMKGMQNGGKKVYESAKQNNERYQEYREYKSKERANRRMDNKVSGVAIGTKIKSTSSTNISKNELKEPKALENKKVSPLDELFEKKEKKEIEEPIVLESEVKKVVPDSVEPSSVDEYPAKEMKSIDDKTDENLTADEYKEPVVTEKAKRKTHISPEELKKEVDDVSTAIKENSVSESYKFPPMSLLGKGNPKAVGNTKAQLRETATKLQQTLENFGVAADVTDYSCGPAVTRYEIQPQMGVKVSKIVNLADDIKLNLAAADIRIEAPIPGKAAIGIEVPNKQNVMVSFRELVESDEFKNAKSKISFAVGKDIAGKIKVSDIAKMPHLLIAGATGSGKSVCINTIIMSILYKAKPDEVKLIMIDPKVVELSVYNGIPHLLIPVVTDPKKASGALNWAVSEMNDRYQKFAETNVREINGYNAKVDAIDVPEGQERPEKMPHIVIIVDELADLMMVASKDVEEAICRLAQLARAAGIHLIIATQRPSVNVITGLIKANMPSRIAFAVSSGTDSRTILDMNGAEKLLGKGDMLFDPQGAPKPLRIQGAFVSDEEVQSVVDYIVSHNQKTSYNADMQQKVESMQNSSNTTVSISDSGENDNGRDSYFNEAAKIIVDKDKASIGMLQRYLKIGFNRAARIMDQLEEAGIVGPEEGTKPRKVLMTEEEYKTFVDECL